MPLLLDARRRLRFLTGCCLGYQISTPGPSPAPFRHPPATHEPMALVTTISTSTVTNSPLMHCTKKPICLSEAESAAASLAAALTAGPSALMTGHAPSQVLAADSSPCPPSLSAQPPLQRPTGNSGLLRLGSSVAMSSFTDAGPQSGHYWDLLASGRLLEMRSQVCQLQPLGRGGQAVVLRGVWQLADVAVKLVVADPASTPTSTLSRLLLEGPLSKRLRAPNVVETYCYSVTRLTSEDIRQCNEADKVSPHPAEMLGGEASDTRSLLDSLLADPEQQGHGQEGRGVEPSARDDGGAAGGPQLAAQAQRQRFDSLDGWGGPGAPKFIVTYSDALSSAGAAPGCFLTQIVMEFCDQGSLASALARGVYARAPIDRASMFAYLRTLYDIAAGMSYLHSNGVIHGDLKPGNVLLRSSRVDLRGYQAKVADFGLAQCMAPGKISLPAEADWSSHPYMAPEHFDGRLVMSSDVWSFAATAHHMWTGMLPYAGLHPLHVCAGVCDGSLRLEAPPLMSPQLWRLLRSCMADDWRRRPTFPQVRAALRRLEDELCGDGLSAHGGLHRE